jgi:hypothetical protein
LTAAVVGSLLPLVPAAAVASSSGSPNALKLHLVCDSAQYDIVAPSHNGAVAIVEGTNLVAVIEGINGVMFDSVPKRMLTSCDTYKDDRTFLYVAEVLFRAGT